MRGQGRSFQRISSHTQLITFPHYSYFYGVAGVGNVERRVTARGLRSPRHKSRQRMINQTIVDPKQGTTCNIKVWFEGTDIIIVVFIFCMSLRARGRFKVRLLCRGQWQGTAGTMRGRKPPFHWSACLGRGCDWPGPTEEQESWVRLSSTDPEFILRGEL